MDTASLFLLLLLLPFGAFVVLGVLAKRLPASVSGWLGTVAMAVCLAIAVYLVLPTLRASQPLPASIVTQYAWLEFGTGFSIHLGVLFDGLSAIMLLVVTAISFLVHVFSLGYMKGETRFGMYYAYLALFTGSMLGLVLSSNLFQLYMFWELVGLSSFLLIGFYFEKPSAVAAAKKAFIVTRFADFGFLVGILILSGHAGTLDFLPLLESYTNTSSAAFQSAAGASFLGASALTWGVALVFVGGAGKSALFPLHIWLPDAMEGPTPVSALIHAATMVVAGVFLVARLFPLFYLVPAVLQVITVVGIFSAFLAAVVACTQTDIKRVLAYSTLSQIGFMITSLGVSGFSGEDGLGYTASVFHLTTHAAFKALLFLGAGAVIHYIHSNEVRDMGGLRKYMPITHASFLIACLAIAGVPPFAGFFSKEAILSAAYHQAPWVYYAALLTSFLTAFYMFRLYFLIFWNKPHHSHHTNSNEGGWTMKLPLLLLAVSTLVAGWMPFGHWITLNGQPLELPIHWDFSIAPILAALLGIAIAFVGYQKPSTLAGQWQQRLGGVYRLAHHKFYVDEAYSWVVRTVFYHGIGTFAAWFDRTLIDGTVHRFGNAWIHISQAIRGLQSGKVQWYGWFFVVGMLLLASAMIFLIQSGVAG